MSLVSHTILTIPRGRANGGCALHMRLHAGGRGKAWWRESGTTYALIVLSVVSYHATWRRKPEKLEGDDTWLLYVVLRLRGRAILPMAPGGSALPRAERIPTCPSAGRRALTAPMGAPARRNCSPLRTPVAMRWRCRTS